MAAERVENVRRISLEGRLEGPPREMTRKGLQACV